MEEGPGLWGYQQGRLPAREAALGRGALCLEGSLWHVEAVQCTQVRLAGPSQVPSTMQAWEGIGLEVCSPI